MKQLLFSSDALPDHLDDAARFAGWREIFDSLICCVDLYRLESQPFAARFEYAEARGVRLSRQSGTTTRIARSRTAISMSPDDDFCFLVNLQSSSIQASQNGEDVTVAPGAPVLLSNDEPTDIRSKAGLNWLAIAVNRDSLQQALKSPEALRARPLDKNKGALFLLERYVAAILDFPAAAAGDPLRKHVDTTITDLVALILGAEREAAELASMRGLRAARLEEILAQIRANFLDPGFSSAAVGKHLSLSPRYVNDLLQETGTSLADRVLELRLQRARANLLSPEGARTRITDIAHACGFNEVSYFNRCFRRRFGASPTQFRGGGESGL